MRACAPRVDDYPIAVTLRDLKLAAGGKLASCSHFDVELPDGRQVRVELVERPTNLGEGLTMYLTESDGVALLRRVVEHAPSGELQFDAFNWLAIKSQWSNAVVRKSGATLHWAINGPDDILAAVPGTRLLQWERWFESATFAQLPRAYRALGKAMSLIPAVANMSQYHRYAF